MRALELSDAHTFLDRSREFLFKSEFEHNLLLSSALALSKSSAPRSPAVVLMAVVDSNNVTRGAALRSPNRRWIVAAADDEASDFLGREIGKREPLARSLFVPSKTENSFLEAFTKTTSRELEAAISQNLMCLTKLKKVDPATGMIRAAAPKDLKKLIQWSHLFAKECGLDESPAEAEEVIRKYLTYKQLYVWEQASQPLAMAAFGGLTPNSVRISMVYTDRTARAKGFATTLVHRLSHRLLTEGHKACVLFSDADNRSANKIYESVGFRTLAKFTELRAPAQAYRSPGNGLTPELSSR